MRLSEEDRIAVSAFRQQKAKDALQEAQKALESGYRHTLINRLYYACYYAASALLMQYKYPAQEHSDVIRLFHLRFISTGLIPQEEGKLYTLLFELRQLEDYNDWKVLGDDDIVNLVAPAEAFIRKLEKCRRAAKL